MPDIQMIIPDAALRNAVAEGITIMGTGSAHESADMPAALRDSDAAAFILDEAAADKKALKAFQDMTEGKNRRVFLLGAADAAWTDHAAVELFAKPVRLGHLLARLAFHLRMHVRQKNDSAMIGPWRLELQNRQIVRLTDNTAIRLTEKETALLDYLAQSDGPVGREELLASVWGHDGRIDTHTLETHIYQLRRKLDPEGGGTNLLTNEGGAYCLKNAQE